MMLPDLGKYAASVLLAYGVSVGALVALVLWTLRQSVRTRETLSAVEQARKGGEGGQDA